MNRENNLQSDENQSDLDLEIRWITAADQAFLDAYKEGGEAEISLIKIEPGLWLRGVIGLETGRTASEISDEELIEWLQGKGGWPINS